MPRGAGLGLAAGMSGEGESGASGAAVEGSGGERAGAGVGAEISFNYLGQFDQMFSESSSFGLRRSRRARAES